MGGLRQPTALEPTIWALIAQKADLWAMLLDQAFPCHFANYLA
jgi:squalene cyclase